MIIGGCWSMRPLCQSHPHAARDQIDNLKSFNDRWRLDRFARPLTARCRMRTRLRAVASEYLTGVVCQRHRRWMNELLVGYARVSTEQQDLTSQRNGLHALGVGDDRIYVDHGLTGTNRDRPGLQLALAACRAGKTSNGVFGGRSWRRRCWN